MLDRKFTLVPGGNGNAGRRVAQRLAARDVPVRLGSRSGTPLFREVLDGRNASLADGVQRALGRAPRDFAECARETAAMGAWSP